MACIISLSTRRYAVQVSDRRVSSAPPGDQPSLHREEAASAIVFLGVDGAVSIGYAGAPHVGRLPTDQWLAELLWGGKARRGFGIGGQAATGRVSEAVHRIRRALAERVDGTEGLEILMSGFRCKSDRWLPVNLRLRRAANRPVNVLGRVRLGARHLVASAIGSPPTLSEFAVALQRIANRANDLMSADESAAALAGLVRTVAARDQGVGVDLITTIIHPPPTASVLCRFSSLSYATGVALQKPSALSLNIPRLIPLGVAEWSPWVIAQQAVRGPAVFYGGSGPTVQADGYTVMAESGRATPLIACSGRHDPSILAERRTAHRSSP